MSPPDAQIRPAGAPEAEFPFPGAARPATASPEADAEFLTTTALVVGGQHLEAKRVYVLPLTPEVVSLHVAGYLVTRDAEGNFPQPVVRPIPCCGRR